MNKYFYLILVVLFVFKNLNSAEVKAEAETQFFVVTVKKKGQGALIQHPERVFSREKDFSIIFYKNIDKEVKTIYQKYRTFFIREFKLNPSTPDTELEKIITDKIAKLTDQEKIEFREALQKSGLMEEKKHLDDLSRGDKYDINLSKPHFYPIGIYKEFMIFWNNVPRYFAELTLNTYFDNVNIYSLYSNKIKIKPNCLYELSLPIYHKGKKYCPNGLLENEHGSYYNTHLCITENQLSPQEMKQLMQESVKEQLYE